MRLFLLLLSIGLPCYSVPPTILVTIGVYQPIVQELIGTTADVVCLVPETANPHTFDPSYQHMQRIAQATLWFTIGDPMESKIAPCLPQCHTVDLRKGLPLLSTSCSCHHASDPHIWTNPRLMKQQVETISLALQHQFPEQQSQIQQSALTLQHKLDLLIQEVDEILSPYRGGVIVIAHDAYGYLFHEYHIEQLAMEHEGKEPSFSQIEHIYTTSVNNHVHMIFSMPQYANKSLQRLASLLNATIIEINPYQRNYFASTRETAILFSKALTKPS